MVPKDHPIRAIRSMADEALKGMDAVFAPLYGILGRPSIPPEHLLRAQLLQVLYSIRSERQLVEQLTYNMLFRWFVGLGGNESVWDASTFSKNRERFILGGVAEHFLSEVIGQAQRANLLSEDHFSVDGTVIEAAASQKSFKPKDGPPPTPPDDPGNPSVDFHGQKRSNATHQSTTDPEALNFRKGNAMAAKLSFLGHVLMENRNGLVVGACLTQATGTAERSAALALLLDVEGNHPITVGADKGYDVAQFVADLRAFNITPHVAQNTTGRRSAIDGRTTRHPGYEASMRIRKRIEEVFGWMKTVGGLRKTALRGLARVGASFSFGAAAYNLVRMQRLLPA